MKIIDVIRNLKRHRLLSPTLPQSRISESMYISRSGVVPEPAPRRVGGCYAMQRAFPGFPAAWEEKLKHLQRLFIEMLK